VPYARLLHALPVRDGRLPTPWLVSQGGFLLGQLAVALALVYFVVLHWEGRDEQLARGTEQLSRANQLISRYVASQLAKQILAGEFVADRHERRRLTFFFSDVKDFTAIADHLEPEDLSQLLNEYLSEMVAIAERHGATIDKFIGDAILAFFGAPQPMADAEQALRAVRMAAEMQRRIAELAAKWRAQGIEEPIAVRMGIHTGRASIGNFGSRTRMDYTAIGRHVNLVIQLQDHAPPGGILVTHATRLLLPESLPLASAGELEVEGFERTVPIHAVDPAALEASGG
jgi:class 3 adenylate cyclase